MESKEQKRGTMAKHLYLNLPVGDLAASMKFFTTLGFAFDKKFTDDKAACLIIGKNIYTMLLKKEFFAGFTPARTIADAKKTAQAIIGISAESRKEVDTLLRKATKAGGKEYRETSDYGWMYSRSFEDLDGHIWEIIFMDLKKMPKEMKKK